MSDAGGLLLPGRCLPGSLREGGPVLATLAELRREREWVVVQMPQILAVLTEF